ncbi:MAG: glutamate synthase large subunit [Alphaproteobacteria bacterium]|nr:glutamate synthase large subunit [Alphaproteobacteria bacterium]
MTQDTFYARAAELEATGLYSAANEHDACGVGLIAAIDGKPRRVIVEKAIEGLQNMWHRGAVDADGKTGDGAGIHVQLPFAFFSAHIEGIGKKLYSDRLAVGMIFLPKKNFGAQEACRAIVETEILRLGYRLYGWRQVPVVSELIGEIANESRPEIEQILIAGHDDSDPATFERDLFIIRKRIENAVRARAIHDFYICSLSSRSIIYKGLFKAEQLTAFYPDLNDARFESNFAVFHQRFSTNTAPAWHLAQPFRVLAHNGEINTLKGNVNFMQSHEATFSSAAFAGFEEDVLPVIPSNTSDTGALDSVMEVLVRAGRPLPLAKLILVPPAWSTIPDLPQAHKDLYACCNSVSEPWDGPAAIAATDGEWVIAGMDRGGLRPMRYTITQEGLLICASESGMVQVPEADVLERGRLGPGDIIGVNLIDAKLYKDSELKDHLAAQQPYGEWVKHLVRLADVVAKVPVTLPQAQNTAAIHRRQRAAGYTMEDIEAILHPMAETAKEAIGSMGDDTPVAILSDIHRPFHHFFRQNFSQVTNPPIDPLRERLVMSLTTRFGNDGNFLALDDSHSEILVADTPVLLEYEMTAIRQRFSKRTTEIATVFPIAEEGSLRTSLRRIVKEAEAAARSGRSFLVLSDDSVDEGHSAIPMILAVSAVHSHLVRKKLRKGAAILVRTAECFDVHALAVLIGAGATVVQPTLAEATILERKSRGLFPKLTAEEALENFREAMNQGLLKIMSKMGISVVSSYRGGLNFEVIGLSRALVAEFFPGLPSRISGVGLAGIEKRGRAMHLAAFAAQDGDALPIGGFYRLRTTGERHGWGGEAIHILQSAVTSGSYQQYRKFSEAIHALPPIHLRDLLDFRSPHAPVSIDTVEPITEIRKRFIAPAMSLGALSPEAHEILAVAMNRIGAASNSGEGGEGSERYLPRENGDNANSVVKQIASGRFGVTAQYLNSAKELQIKVAQGAKPGEGGQLPAFKVTVEIARLRHATEGVSLISPPPHHDIYSIEDLAQLIYDLKQINPHAIVSVKLVAQAGIGTIAAGVAKAMADKIVISGHSGGTGASPWSSVKHAGAPWEMGLAEANQVLTLNRMRHRVKLQTDGGLKTGRDIVIATLLGAEEYALGTGALIALGCILVRQCHSNTCPVGIATQDPLLREKFDGTVDKVVNLLSFIAEEVREILAQLGFTSLQEIVGRTDLLHQVNRGSEDLVDLDLNTLLAQADPGSHPRYYSRKTRNEVPDTLDSQMIPEVSGALDRGEKIQLAYTVRNVMRAVGTRLSSHVVTHPNAATFHDDHITLRLRGSAGQSLGAFLARGIRIELYGDANDYVGKGLSGGQIIIRPRPSSQLAPHANTIIGNTVLYGATSGLLLASGQAGERFAVRNSGATVVVEGCGSNGCEYMTGGTAVILGSVGHNFGAGMTGGMAFVYDPQGNFAPRVNDETVVFQRVASAHWETHLRDLIARHKAETGSPIADQILTGWAFELPHFWQVCPKEMLDRLAHPLSDAAESSDKRA